MADNWVQEMIEREALPKATREETIVQFCARHKISESTYYYQSSKTDNWVQEMIEREALPKATREETVEQFCDRHKISVSTYYYQSSKTDNWKKVLEISLMSAKKEVPEVLQVLAEKAKGGDAKFVDMYLNYVVQLAKNLDIKSDGKPLPILNLKDVPANDSNTEDNSTKEED